MAPQVTLTPVQNPSAESTFRDPTVPATGGAAAPQPFPSDVPRIRLPQGTQSPTEPVAVPSGVQTMSYQMELPPAGVQQAVPPAPLTPPAMHPAPPMASPYGVVPASYTQVPQPPVTPDGFQPRGEARRRAEQQQATGVVPATFASATLPGTGQQAYGYGASYEWLQGRLEYSAILGHWTLRYMPVGGSSDAFGGSVAIYNTDALAGYCPGDFVTMQGQLVATGIDPSMPVAYSVYTIQRQ